MGKSKKECLERINRTIEQEVVKADSPPPFEERPTIEIVAESNESIDRLIKVPEACRILALSQSSLRRYAKAGKIPAVHFGRAYRFKLSHILGFVEQNPPSDRSRST